jgi:hypothetical protein
MVDDICKKEMGRLASPEEPKTTLDAEIHKQQLTDAREARNVDYSEPTVAKPSEVYTPSRNDTDADGMKEAQDVDAEYSMNIKPTTIGKKASTPVIDEVDHV